MHSTKLSDLRFVKYSKMLIGDMYVVCLLQEGIGINEILTAIVQRIPPPPDSAGRPLRALIFDRYQTLQHIYTGI